LIFLGGIADSFQEYKSRFREAMDRYILQAPNSWHQWRQLEPKPEAKREPPREVQGVKADAAGGV